MPGRPRHLVRFRDTGEFALVSSTKGMKWASCQQSTKPPSTIQGFLPVFSPNNGSGAYMGGEGGVIAIGVAGLTWPLLVFAPQLLLAALALGGFYVVGKGFSAFFELMPNSTPKFVDFEQP